MAARNSGGMLECFLSVEEFLQRAGEFPVDCTIYVDSNLDGARGEDEVYRLRDAGFTKLYIATGYSPEDIDVPEFVLGVVGKRAPF